MKSNPKVLLLIGSPKQPGRSTSESLGGYLCDRLVDQGWEIQTFHVHKALRTEERTQAMLNAVDATDLFVLATPLYVDSLPYLVTDALERIAAHRAGIDAHAGIPRFVPLINCGFPEAVHNDVALAICEQFAQFAKLEWAGGLSMGAGGFIGGKPLTDLGGRGTSIRDALELAADALAVGQPVPDEAATLLAEPAIPHRLYTTIGNLGWYHTAWKQGTVRRLHDQPFTGVDTWRGSTAP